MPPLKTKISITLDAGLLDWIDEGVNKKKFANRSHGIEFCVKRTRNGALKRKT